MISSNVNPVHTTESAKNAPIQAMETEVTRVEQNREAETVVSNSPKEETLPTQAMAPPAPPPPSDYVTGQELFDLPFEDVPHLLEGLIQQKSLAALTGTSDVGKSLWALNLALHIVKGSESFCGRKLTTKYRKVLYISTEDLDYDIALRLKKMVTSPDDKEALNRIHFRFCNGPEIKNHVQKFLSQMDVDCVMLDVITDIFHGNSNDTTAVKNFLNPFKDIVQKRGCVVMYLHHTKKGGNKESFEKDDTLGSQAWESSPRSTIRIIRDPNYPGGTNRIIALIKGNSISDKVKKRGIPISFDTDSLRFKEAGLTTRGLFIEDETHRVPYAKTTDSVIIKRVLELEKDGYTILDTVEQLKLEKFDVRKNIVHTIRKNNKNKSVKLNEPVVKLDNPNNLLG